MKYILDTWGLIAWVLFGLAGFVGAKSEYQRATFYILQAIFLVLIKNYYKGYED